MNAQKTEGSFVLFVKNCEEFAREINKIKMIGKLCSWTFAAQRAKSFVTDDKDLPAALWYSLNA